MKRAVFLCPKEATIVSGYDNTPPDDQYEPEFGSGIRLILITIVAIIAFASFGWLFV